MNQQRSIAYDLSGNTKRATPPLKPYEFRSCGTSLSRQFNLQGSDRSWRKFVDQRRAADLQAVCLRHQRIRLSEGVMGMNVGAGQGGDGARLRGGAADGYFCKP